MSEEVTYSDKRQCLRHRRRFSLRFEDVSVNGNGNGNGEGRLAYTEDISRKGLFIKTVNVVRPGSQIQVTLTLPGGVARLEGHVKWAKKVQPAFLNRVHKAGMGVSILSFLAGEGVYMALCDELEVS